MLARYQRTHSKITERSKWRPENTRNPSPKLRGIHATFIVDVEFATEPFQAGLDFAVTPGATVGVSYHGQFASGVSDQSVRADFSMKF